MNPLKNLVDRPVFTEAASTDGPGLTVGQLVETLLVSSLASVPGNLIVGQTVDRAQALADELFRRWEAREYARVHADKIAQAQSRNCWVGAKAKGGAA